MLKAIALAKTAKIVKTKKQMQMAQKSFNPFIVSAKRSLPLVNQVNRLCECCGQTQQSLVLCNQFHSVCPRKPGLIPDALRQ